MTIFLRPLHLSTLALCVLCASVSTAGCPALAQNAATQPDNSAQNKHLATTADNQPDAKADRLTTAKVRKAIIADKSLSTYAHNVKIITRNGTVTLEGPVKSEDEKQKVATDVANVLSPDKLIDDLTVR